MKVVICNMGYSGYWAACWRELARRVDLAIVTPSTKYPYPKKMLAGLPVRVLSETEMQSPAAVADVVEAESPDVLVISGWAAKSFCSLVYDKALQLARKVLIVDSAWEGTLRQIFSRFWLWRYVKRFDGIIVGGSRGCKFARWIGFKEDRIFRSIYGYEASAFASCFSRRRLGSNWPRRFCFVGRLSPVKGLLVLVEAYKRYRERVDSPWPLDCYGTGDLREMLEDVSGIVVHGFLKPEDLPGALVGEGVFVFPSIHEPWGVALVEAAGSGLPLICSDRVSSGDDVVRHGQNGYVVPVGDANALCTALMMMHNRYVDLPSMGAISMRLAEDFSPEIWADRWMEAFHVLGR